MQDKEEDDDRQPTNITSSQSKEKTARDALIQSLIKELHAIVISVGEREREFFLLVLQRDHESHVKLILILSKKRTEHMCYMYVTWEGGKGVLGKSVKGVINYVPFE